MTTISVSTVGSRAYLNDTVLQKATVASGIISDFAFYGCTNLTDVSLGSGITKISEYSFYGCTRLTSIVIPASVTHIGDCAFAGCTSLANVYILNPTIKISESAFFSNTSTFITLSNGTQLFRGPDAYLTSKSTYESVYEAVESSGNYLEIDWTAKKCYGYRQASGYPQPLNVAIPHGIEYIEFNQTAQTNGYGFNGPTTIRGFFFPATLKRIPNNMFDQNVKYITTLEFAMIPVANAALDIDDDAFFYKTLVDGGGEGIIYLYFPAYLRKIGKRAFQNRQLNGVYFANTELIDICNGVVLSTNSTDAEANGTFYHDTNLYYSQINAGGFFNTSNLRVSSYTSSTVTFAWDSPNDMILDTTSPLTQYRLYIDNQLVTTQRGSLRSYTYSYTSGVDVTFKIQMIFDGYIENFGGPLEVTFVPPLTVTSPGAKSYANNTQIQIVNINSTTDIGEFAFYGCTDLADVSLNSGVTGILAYAFYGCNKIQSIVIPASVTRIGDCAFADCSGLTSVHLMNASTTISECAFIGSPNVTVHYPNGTTKSGDEAGNGVVASTGNFLNINWTTKKYTGYDTTGKGYPQPPIVALPDGAERQDDATLGTSYAFPSLKGIFFPRSMKEAGYYARVSTLQYVKFSSTSNSSNLKIRNTAFCYTGITSIKIPTYVKFEDEGLPEFDTTTSPPLRNWGIGIFQGCSSLTYVEFLGPTLYNLYLTQSIFEGCTSLTTLKLPVGLVEVQKGAGSYNTALQTVTFAQIAGLDVSGYARQSSSLEAQIQVIRYQSLQQSNNSVFYGTPYMDSLIDASNNIKNLTATTVSDDTVLLTWTAPPINSPAIEYELTTNSGTPIRLPATTTSYMSTVTYTPNMKMNYSMRMMIDGFIPNAGGALTKVVDISGFVAPPWWSTYVANASTIATTLATRYAPEILNAQGNLNYYLSNAGTFSGTYIDWESQWITDISLNATSPAVANRGRVMLLYIYQTMMAAADATTRDYGKSKLATYIPAILQFSPGTPPLECSAIDSRIYVTWTPPTYFWNSFKSYNIYLDSTLTVSDVSSTGYVILSNVSTGSHMVEVSAVSFLGAEGTKSRKTVLVTGTTAQWLQDVSDTAQRTVHQSGTTSAGLDDLIELDAGQLFAIRPKMLGALGAEVQTPAVPAPPTDISGSATNKDEITVTWDSALYDYPAVTAYDIFVTDVSTSTTWTINTGSTELTYAVTGLSSNHFYEFKVRGVNSLGIGNWSAPSAAIQALSVPQAPTAPTLTTQGLGTLYMTWTAPTSFAAAPILSYTIELVDVSNSANNLTISDVLFQPFSLTGRDSTYKFRIRAHNTYGAGDWSGYSTIVTPNALPGVPDLSGGFIGRDWAEGKSVLLNWTTPSLNKGPPILTYYVTVSGAQINTETIGNSYTINVLDYGVSYSVTIRAYNANGVGPESNTLIFLPTTIPKRPTISSVSTLDLSATIVWSPPAFTGGTPITSYNLYVNGIKTVTDISAGVTSYNYVVPAEGVRYGFSVSATNAVGEGPWSSWVTSDIIRVRRVPSAPVEFGKVNPPPYAFTWQPPEDDGYTPITGYDLTIYSADIGNNVTVNTVSVSGDVLSYQTAFTENDSFFVSICAKNRIGSGPSVNSDHIKLLNLTAVPSGDKSILLSWTKPTGFPDPSGYKVTYFDDIDICSNVLSILTLPADASSCTIQNVRTQSSVLGLYAAGRRVTQPFWDDPHPNIEEVFSISNTFNGRNLFIQDASASPVTKPGLVTSLQGGVPPNYGNQTLELTWRKPYYAISDPIADDGGSPITHYLIDISSRIARYTDTFSSTPNHFGGFRYTRNISVPGDYIIRVAAANAYATGDYVISSSPHRFALPPTDVSATPITGMSALVTWKAPTIPDDTTSVNYNVQYAVIDTGYNGMSLGDSLNWVNQGNLPSTSPITATTPGNQTYLTLQNLPFPIVKLIIRVQTVLEGGLYSSWTPWILYNPDNDFNDIIPFIIARQRSNNIYVEWSPTQGAAAYEVEASVSGENPFTTIEPVGDSTSYVFRFNYLPIYDGLYTFRVRAISAFGTEGRWNTSNTVNYGILPIHVPASPTAIQQGNKILLQWGPIEEATFYWIMYSKNGVSTGFAWEQSFTTSFSFPEYADPLEVGATYSFKIMAAKYPKPWGVRGARAITENGSTGGWASTNTVTYTLDGSGGGGGGGGGGAICFFGNAPVLTPTGYRTMDSFRTGDNVQTADGRVVKVQRVLRQRIPASPQTNPYRIARGQFGATQSVLISPDHRVAVAGRGLIEACRLGLPQVERTGILTYYNLELPDWKRDNMVVAGVEVESLAPVRRIRISYAEFIRMLRNQYGNQLTAATLENIRRKCVFAEDGTVEVPLIHRA